MKVLVTDSNYKHTLGIIRVLGKTNATIDLIGYDKSLCTYSRFANAVVFSQDKFCDAYLDEFISFIKENKYDFLLPVSAKSVEFVSKYQHSISQFTRVFVPKYESVQLCLDKYKTYEFFKGSEVLQPQTLMLDNITDIDEKLKSVSYPVAIKGKDEFSKIETVYANNSKQLKRIIHSFHETYRSFPLIQSKIIGGGYGFFALYENGHCVSYFMHKRIREYPVNGGSSTCAESYFDQELYESGKRVLDMLKWNGVAMVEFKKCQNTGKYILIEINPKYWGSLDLALASGILFPMQTVFNNDILRKSGDAIQYKYPIRYHWPFDGDILHVLRRPKSLISFFVDVFNPLVKSNISFTDFKPTLFAIRKNLSLKIILYTLLKDSSILKLIIRSREVGLKIAFVRFFSETTGIQLIRYSKILPNIYVGCQHGKLGKILLKLHGINASLSLRDEFDDLETGLNFTNYLHIPIVEYSAPTQEQLSLAMNFIEENVSKGNKVFIHCSEGVSRAATVAICYLMKKGFTNHEAIDKVKEVRPFIKILSPQQIALKKYFFGDASN